MADEPRSAEERLRAELVRRAIETEAPLLAVRLHRVALSDGVSWAEFAASLGSTEDGLNRLACCRPPRPESLDGDLAALAEVCGIPKDRLAVLLDDFGPP